MQNNMFYLQEIENFEELFHLIRGFPKKHPKVIEQTFQMFNNTLQNIIKQGIVEKNLEKM